MISEIDKVTFSKMNCKRKIEKIDFKMRESAHFMGNKNNEFGLIKGKKYFIDIGIDNGRYAVTVTVGEGRELRYERMKDLLREWSFENLENESRFDLERIFGYA